MQWHNPLQKTPKENTQKEYLITKLMDGWTEKVKLKVINYCDLSQKNYMRRHVKIVLADLALMQQLSDIILIAHILTTNLLFVQGGLSEVASY